MAKKFFYVCAGLFLLAGAFALGARSAGAQAGSVVTGMTMVNVGCGAELFVLTSNGDVFRRPYGCGQLTGATSFIGNYWGGATPADGESFGSLKVRYR